MEMVLSHDKNIALAKQGNRRALAKLLTIIESGERLPIKESNESWVLGVTGPPGVGKSTLIGVMIDEWVRRGEKVAVLAIDPSSPKSGGALLGDRMRMSSADNGESVFIRSLATRNHPGGLMPFLDSMINLLSYCGWTKIIIETVGSGQSEIRIVAFANRIMLVDGPDRGDIIQAEKAGLLELADLIVVNKSDLDGAERVVNDLTISLSLTNDAPPIIRTSAITGEGLDELSDLILSVEERNSSKRARARQQLLMAHENRIIRKPAFDTILDRMSEEGLSVKDALRELDE